MDNLTQKTANDYQIAIEPLDGTVIARRGDIVLASSTNAKVMYETRLQPVIYFPEEDVSADLFKDSDFRTFCPFRGTATYSDLKIGDELVTNSAWHYRNALSEGRDVEGHFAFMPGTVSDFDLSATQLRVPAKGNIAGPVVDWVMREAWICKSPEELTAAFARKLLDDGVAISRLSVMIWSLHPLIAGKIYLWQKDTDRVSTYLPSYDILQDPSYVNSPLRHVANGLGGVRQRLDGDSAEFSFPIMDDLRAQGATDYVAMPLPFSNGQMNVLTLTCDHPNGFTTTNLGLVFECATVMSRYYEVFTLKENAQSLLETYLGKRTGARVLGGDIRRGDGDEIDAAILFCDLRDSTLLAERMQRDQYLELLNRFFEATTEIINTHDGEVLKFIGDAVLAIFPAGENRAAACKKALAASKEIVGALAGDQGPNGDAPIECAIGVSFGNVTYGNVGSQERLDFTVIGSAANVAARLGEYGKQSGDKIVASGDVVIEKAGVRDMGRINLHNVTAPVSAFAISAE